MSKSGLDVVTLALLAELVNLLCEGLSPSPSKAASGERIKGLWPTLSAPWRFRWIKLGIGHGLTQCLFVCVIAHKFRKNAQKSFCVSMERVTRARSICNRISVRMLIRLTYLSHEMFQCVSVCDQTSSRNVSTCNIRRGGGRVLHKRHRLRGTSGGKGVSSYMYFTPPNFLTTFPEVPEALRSP